ncbi:uncharacterized protein DUF4932 [Chitinophaga niastensis]|uniref:Uncharacterized protein DUF4932 n=1 Tax=Chitinophaga niastensis TaxID=536980 RepID=A0A2P8HEK7_CHINA|nr:DUF4932 domain-containing protein [Chitinophaga niastensis]PSL44659.1 uncharacterized protein DUF4932 [Chitinophaga niastensis]
MKHVVIPLLLVILTLNRLQAQDHIAVDVKIDPRFEALSIFYFLALKDSLDADERPSPSVYYKAVKQHFGPYDAHPALMWYRKLSNWDGYDMPSLGIFLSDTPVLKPVAKMEFSYVKNGTTLQVLLDKVNTFYKDSRAGEFMQEQKGRYKKVEADGKAAIVNSGILRDVQAFYGNHQVKRVVIFPDLLNNIGNNAIPLQDGKYKEACMMRIGYITDSTDNLTDDSMVRFSPPLNVIAHECSHVFLHDFLVRYRSRLFAVRRIFLESADGEKYEEQEWENEMEELLVRACVAGILARRDGVVAGEMECSGQARKYRYMPGLYELLGKYAAERNKYHTIQEFYPRIMAWFEQLAATTSAGLSGQRRRS